MPSNEWRGLEGAPENRVVGAKPKAVWSAARHAPARKGGVPRRDILEALRAALMEEPHAAILCASPGMGKTVLAEAVRDGWLAEGRGVIATYLDGMEAGRAISRLNSIVRSYAQKKSLRQGTLVLIDGLPAGDDYQVEKMAVLLRKLLAAGMALVVTLRPEAEQICELFPDALCLGSRDLTVAYEDRAAWGEAALGASRREFAAATQGIPALLDGLGAVAGQRPYAWDARLASGALAEMASVAVRSSLMDEERRVRLAMMLLGSAGFEELGRAVPRLDDAVLSGLAREEPFFGIDAAASSFACAGLADERVLGSCLPALRSYAAEEAETVEAVCEVLGKAGRIRRMAAVAEGLLPPARRTRLMMRWPAELADAGLIGSLRSAVTHFDEAEANAHERFCLGVSRIVLSCITGSGGACREARSALAYPIDARGKAMLAQADAFLEAFAGVQAADEGGPDSTDALAEDLRSHARIFRLLFTGDFEEAFRQAVLSRSGRAGESLASSLLADDLALVRLLMGDAEPSSEDCRRIGSFLMRPGYKRLRILWRAAFETACALRGMPCDEDAIDEGVKAAQAAGGGSAAASFLLAGASLDLSGGAYARALVRSEQAAIFARAAGGGHLALEAEAYAALAERCAGGRRSKGRDELDGIAGARPECALAIALAGERPERAQAYAEKLAAFELRASAIPLLRTVERLSRRGLLPPMPKLAGAWARALDDGRPPTSAPAAEPSEAPAPAGGQPLIEAEVMGVFSARRDGVPIPEAAWKRQASRTIFALLCAAKGHELTRANLCALIWPDRDFAVARSSLYAALSTLKSALGQRADGPQPLVTRDGRVVLDAALVSSDVDRLVAVAGRMLLQKDDDATLVERGRELERLKPTGLPCVENDPTGIMEARCRELGELYTDAMIAGGEAALRMGLVSVAVRFSLEASAFDPAREDAELLVLRSFSAAGRETEARTHYDRFARALIELTGEPPSPMMRREAARICGKARRLPPEPRVDEAILGSSPEDGEPAESGPEDA